MAEWDGIRLRALFQENVPGLLDVMVRMHGDQEYEVQMLVARMCDLVHASQNPRDPAALREPLIALLNVMAIHMPVFMTHPYKYQVYLMGRVFATLAMQIVDLYEQLDAPTPVFNELMGWFTYPEGFEPPPIIQQPMLLLANEEQKPILMSAKRKLVFPKEDPPTSPKRKLLIPKEEVVSPIVVAEKRRSTRKSGVALDESVADTPRFNPALVKVELVDEDEMEEVGDDIEKKKCDHCNSEVPVSEMEQLKHAWKKHKNLVHKYIRPELVCTIDYCDYVSTSVNVRKIHVGRHHGIKPLAQRRVVSELKGASKCPYCSTDIASIVDLKKHVLQCTQRDERPMLGCSFCPKQTFHFIYDFSAHLKKFGGVTHGKPVLLSYN